MGLLRQPPNLNDFQRMDYTQMHSQLICYFLLKSLISLTLPTSPVVNLTLIP